MKHIHGGNIISVSKWPSVRSIEPALDASFVTYHDGMTLQDNQWTNMVENWMDIEYDKDIINEELAKVLGYIDNDVVELQEDKAE